MVMETSPEQAMCIEYHAQLWHFAQRSKFCTVLRFYQDGQLVTYESCKHKQQGNSFHEIMLSSMAFSPKLSLIAIIFSCRTLVFALNSTVVFTSNSSLNWTNGNGGNVETYQFPFKLIFRAILQTGVDPELYGKYSDAISFAFGFYCNIQYVDTCLLSIIMLDSRNGVPLANRPPRVVWEANRNHPVKVNATLHFEPGRGLVLTESDGREAWSTKIHNNTLATGMSLGGNGDLVLFGNNHSTLWRSFDHPSDTLVIGQELRGRQSLRSRSSNYFSREGRFSLSLTSSRLTAFMQSDSYQAYLNFTPNSIPTNSKLQRVIYYGNNISFIYKNGSTYLSAYWMVLNFAPIMSETAPTVRILTLGWDGGVREHVWYSEIGWSNEANTVGGYDECLIPLVCGDYAVCTGGGCICPIASDGSDYFTAIDPTLPNRGCSFLDHSIPSSILAGNQQLLDFGNLSYFSYSDPAAAIANFTELGKCMQACEGNSSCKAAFFSFRSNASDGLCYLISQVLTIIQGPIQEDLSTIAAIKVPIPYLPHSSPPSLPLVDNGDGKISRFSLRSTTGKTMLVVLSVFVSVIVLCVIFRTIKHRWSCRGKECFELVPGAPIRFTYKELSAATGKFSTRLGRGGFGTVFKGELKDGTVIAVKRLECVEQGTGEFLAEMKTMGSLHHYNLVKLIGFCADESNRLLVYEYMSNSSLDKWIFDCKGKQVLTWETRRRIILDVARGLAYLHEECSQRIAHLDMKPHNILLDDNFNAKISDFGLARFIDRNQSQVVTAMRGTLGYLAPEWLNSRITVKVDIYSFGVVILEAVSGRMNLDYSQTDLDVHLLGILQRKASEDRLIDIVDKRIVDWESHGEDIVKMIRIGAWCLNEDQSKRPSMSTVVKVLEGAVEMKNDIDFKFGHVLILSCETSVCSSQPSSKCSSC